MLDSSCNKRPCAVGTKVKIPYFGGQTVKHLSSEQNSVILSPVNHRYYLIVFFSYALNN